MSLHASQITVPVGTNVRALLVAMAALTALCLPGLAARAQQPAVVGGAGEASVEVDLSVLDELGAAPATPGLLMPESNRGLGEKIILRPPGKTSAGKPAVPAPSPAPPKPAIAAESAPEALPAPIPAPGDPVAREKAPPPPRLTPPPMTAPSPSPPVAAVPSPAPPKPAIAAESAPEALPAPKPAPRDPVAREKAPPPSPPVAAAPSPAPPKPASSKPAPAKAAPEIMPAPRQTAVVAPAPKSWGKGSTLRIAFDGGSAKLPDEAKADLEALARALAEDSRLRLQVKAYAAGTKDSTSRARRLSLSRALSVRSYLIGQGLRSTRIDVRALGDKAEGGPADRADLLVVSRR